MELKKLLATVGAFICWSVLVSLYPQWSWTIAAVSGLITLFGIAAVIVYLRNPGRGTQFGGLLALTFLLIILPIRAATAANVPWWGILLLVLAFILAWVLPNADPNMSQRLYDLYNRRDSQANSEAKGVETWILAVFGAIAASGGMYLVRSGNKLLVHLILFIIGSLVVLLFAHFFSHQILYLQRLAGQTRDGT